MPTITIFNPDIVKDKATFEKPHPYPSGFDYVMVKGQLAVSNGAWTGIRGGQVLGRQKSFTSLKAKSTP